MHVTGNNIRTNTRIKFLTKKPPIAHSATLLSVPNNSVTECMNRALNQATPTKHLRITYDQYIDGMKMFPVDIQIHHVMGFYSNVCAVDCSDYIRKTGSRFKCASMLACSTALWEFDIAAEIQIIPSHSAGRARLRVD